ncbi:hypothetical protein Aeqsu_3224 [Aequorivita sublithincola DSM 14238]|uniref:Secretion system C-terminal sorting domain-containing protein n=1 Tax=Aequorivita sublithincola (strain DSM 14238 / LMG 21431 / ACAM 643 / 9-3) TaxID=746697 RepID=I3Z085_AEQSU|nr:T9SS type A sorting domain-containing protein [Aequorivita sublithincola]AFL82653.1 hypothetical protein Aeqsu_3224 [Aequorivita sublithincola DSM 14238]
MRKITLLLACFIGFSGVMTAQNAQTSSDVDGLLNRLSQIGTNAGDVSAYFTSEEQATLRSYFVSNQTVVLPAAYYNANLANVVGETTGVSSNSEISLDLNAKVPFTGTYYYRSPNALVYDNGPYFNIPGPPPVSQLQDASLLMSLYGFGAQFTADNRMADDFTLTADYDITSVDVYAYQTGATPPSITALYVQVWDGDPSGGGASVIWGDLVTNVLDNVADSGALRQLESAPGDTSRKIQTATANTTGLSLTAGTYWIEYTFEGSGASGPWAPPIVITGTATTGNALQYTGASGLYNPAIDTGSGTPQGMPFVLFGDIVGGGPGDPAVAFGANNTTSSLITFDPADPAAFTTLGTSPAPVFENAGAVDPNDDTTAYVLDSGGLFYSVDLTTGVYTNLGTILAPGGNQWSGAEFDPISGTLYAISVNGALTATTLSTIDIGALTATTIGLTGMAGGISLMIDANGDGYSHDIADDNFYYVDLASGTASPIGPLGFDANFGQGGTFIDGDPGFVYLSAFDSGSFQSQWRRVDVLTGSSTVIGLFNGGADQVGWSSAKGSLAVGIAENALEGFSYAPNPTSGVLSLKSINNIDTVAIYNMLGQNVMSSKIGATTSDLDISSLKTGTYIMQVTVGGQTAAFRVLKN